MPLPSLRTARRCHAKAKHSGLRCHNPAAYGMGVCRVHGARKAETIRRGEDHPRYKHGQKTKEAKRAHKEDMDLLRLVRAWLAKLNQLP
jgi:hypothetical protein